MATRVMPTFLLKGVDPAKLLSDYHAGVFSRPIPVKAPIRVAHNSSVLAPTYGTSNQDPIFTIKDRNNNSVVIATSNHAPFETFTSSGGTLPKGGRCEFCRDDFEHTIIGYPLAYEEETILTPSMEDPTQSVYRVIYIFWVEGRFCSFECCLAYVRNTMMRPADHRDTMIRDSERMLKLLHKLSYPASGSLRTAQDPRLLKCNGGPLSREEWLDQRHTFVRTDRVLMIPAKAEYIQQNFTHMPHVTMMAVRPSTLAVIST